MKSQFTNICHNPRFSLWPYGTSGFSVSGGTAARWKLERTSSSDLVTVSQGTNSSDTSYDKWLRGAKNLTLNITGLDAATTLRIRQFLEDGQRFGQSLIAVTVIASGPAGESFYFGAGDNYDKITTLGDSDGGVPYLVTKTSVFPFDDPAYEYLRITPFESPSATGTYRLHHVQAQVIDKPEDILPLEIRPEWQEWDLVKRYVCVAEDCVQAVAASTSTIRAYFKAPVGGWRIPPVVQGLTTTPKIYAVTGTGTEVVGASSLYSISSSITATTYGCAVTISGFTGLTTGTQYMLANNNGSLLLLSADYWD